MRVFDVNRDVPFSCLMVLLTDADREFEKRIGVKFEFCLLSAKKYKFNKKNMFF